MHFTIRRFIIYASSGLKQIRCEGVKTQKPKIQRAKNSSWLNAKKGKKNEEAKLIQSAKFAARQASILFFVCSTLIKDGDSHTSIYH